MVIASPPPWLSFDSFCQETSRDCLQETTGDSQIMIGSLNVHSSEVEEPTLLPGLFVGKLATCAEARKLPTSRFDAISKRRPLQRSLKRPFLNRGLPEKCQRHSPNELGFECIFKQYSNIFFFLEQLLKREKRLLDYTSTWKWISLTNRLWR